MNQTWFKKTIAALVSVGVLSFSGAGIAFADVDQEHVTVVSDGDWDSICYYDGRIIQTFTAGITGLLTKVSVNIVRGEGDVDFVDDVSVSAEIHTTISGVPTDTMLGSGSKVVPGGYQGWIDIEVDSVSIAKDTTYALFLKRNDCDKAEGSDLAWSYDVGNGMQYPGGSSWYWNSKDGQYETWQEQDYLFRTYVTPPPPPSTVSTNNNLYRVILSTGSEDITLWGVNGPMSTSVPNHVEAITVTPELANGAAKATVNGTPVDHKGQISIPLAVGNNVIAITVTAESGHTRTHYVMVRRAVGNNADLKGIVVQGHGLMSSFAAKTTEYTVKVGSDVKELTLGAVTADRSATVTINGTAANVSAAATTVPLADGDNTVTFDVTAQDGVTHKVYTLVIIRGDSK